MDWAKDIIVRKDYRNNIAKLMLTSSLELGDTGMVMGMDMEIDSPNIRPRMPWDPLLIDPLLGRLRDLLWGINNRNLLSSLLNLIMGRRSLYIEYNIYILNN